MRIRSRATVRYWTDQGELTMASADMKRCQRGVPRLRMTPSVSEAIHGYLFLLPLLLVVVGLLGYPLLNAILMSFQRKTIGIAPQYVGLANYRRFVVEDPVFPKILRNTFLYSTLAVALKVTVGLVMALVLNERIIARNLFRGLLMISWVTPQVVAALNWRWILSSTGVLSYLVINLGLANRWVSWLGTPGTALASLILVNVWSGFPFFGLNMLARIQTIPPELYEAAEVDGASAWQRFVHVTIPGLQQVMVVLFTLSFIWTWNMFAQVWLITGGGPANSTQLVATYAYEVGLGGQNLGYATTVSLVFLPVLMLAVGLLTPILLADREA